MKRLVLAGALMLGACGGDNPSYKIGGNTLTVKDTGYVTSTSNTFCPGAAIGQTEIVLVDYSPICGPNIGIDADGGARDPQLEHTELTLIYVTGAQQNPKLPFPVSTPDCNIGPAGPGIAYFDHYKSGIAAPSRLVASGGSMMLTYVDPTGAKPATGSFDLDFGTNGKISGDFTTFTCN